VLEAELKYVPGGEICGEAQYISHSLVFTCTKGTVAVTSLFFSKQTLVQPQMNSKSDAKSA
jgi:hypothetical protein